MLMFGRGPSGVGSPEINDSERRHADQIKFGIVRQADYANAMVRVAIGDEDDPDGFLLTGWLPMAGGRAGGDRTWHPLEIDERVMVLSESGELQNGMVMPAGLYNSDHPAPGDKPGLWRISPADGATIEYDRDTGEFLVDAKTKATLKVGDVMAEVSADAITLTVGGVTFAVSASGITINGGTVTHNGKNIGATHTHSGVKAGPDISGVPN